jgi:hypothetical protein
VFKVHKVLQAQLAQQVPKAFRVLQAQLVFKAILAQLVLQVHNQQSQVLQGLLVLKVPKV